MDTTSWCRVRKVLTIATLQITVSKIPNFDPTTLPYWDLYVKEGKAHTIRVGGTLAGNFTGKLVLLASSQQDKED